MNREEETKLLSFEGKIPFVRFMEMALYHPLYGYYTSGRTKIGKKGDYYTSPMVHSIFGKLICRQVVEMWNVMGKDNFTIVEMGAGEGLLSIDILKCAKDEYPEFYRNLGYVIIDVGSNMTKRQEDRLKREGLFDAQVLWTDYSDSLFKEGINGCFLSNELVDSFPVHVVKKQGGGLREIYVTLQNGQVVEIANEPSTPELERYFHRIGIELEEGQRAEVNLKAVEWMRWVGTSLKKGFVITIDYGYPAKELYSPHRRDGTLLCYYKHRISTDPYENVGRQDMTTHVDFTTLMLIGEEVGLKVMGFTDQMHFLFGLDILNDVKSTGRGKTPEDGLRERLLIKNLIMPGGMGEVFKVLIQSKGLEDIPPLSGLKKNPFISRS